MDRTQPSGGCNASSTLAGSAGLWLNKRVMFKRVILPFFLSFGAGGMMVLLYIWLPQYLLKQIMPQEKLLAQVEAPLILASPSPSPDLSPATVIIPKLKITAAVEMLGVTETNNLAVPKNAGNVGWYMYGPKPSEPGNAVIAGHYDTPTGRPAVFYYLDKLEKGDEIEVISQNAVRNIFIVVDKATVPYDKFPNEEVFSTRPGANLNLITCGGIWDPAKRTYSQRLIIYTVLKSSLNESQS